MVHDIDFTVELKKLSFTHRLSGHFLNRCGIKSLHQGSSWSYGFRYNLATVDSYTVVCRSAQPAYPGNVFGVASKYYDHLCM
jgi:hypothetical protein